jgi:hypothetical protein
MPIPEAAGKMRMETGAPLCNPMPLQAAAARIVCSYVNGIKIAG